MQQTKSRNYAGKEMIQQLAKTYSNGEEPQRKRPKPWDESTEPLFEAIGLHGKPKGQLYERPRPWDKTRDQGDSTW